MNSKFPDGYMPLKKLTVCSNTITGGGNLLSVSGEFPLLIGKGSTPKVWLSAVGNAETNKFVTIVESSVSMHSAVKVIKENNLVVVSLSGKQILKAKATSIDVVVVDQLDFRPLGLNIHGNNNALTVGGSTFSNNSMSGGGTLIGFGS